MNDNTTDQYQKEKWEQQRHEASLAPRKCPTCGKNIENQPPSRDYTDKCTECFAKGFVNSIFDK
jgi:hypothetical protein